MRGPTGPRGDSVYSVTSLSSPVDLLRRVASQPAPFSQGQTAILPRTDVSVQEDNTQLGVLEESVSLSELVDGLNAMGVSPRDMITILQAIKAAGALQAEIEVL